MVGGCGSDIGPPLVGMPLNPGNIGKGCSLIPGLSPNIVPGPSSFIGDNCLLTGKLINSHYNFFLIAVIRFLNDVTRSLHFKRPRHTDVPTPRAALLVVVVQFSSVGPSTPRCCSNSGLGCTQAYTLQTCLSAPSCLYCL